MKSIIDLLFAVPAILIASVAIAGADCSDPSSLQQAKIAHSLVLQKLSSTIKGQISVGIGECAGCWSERVLGKVCSQLLQPPECGVILGFNNANDEILAAQLLGSSVEISPGTNVRVYGHIIGTVGAQ